MRISIMNYEGEESSGEGRCCRCWQRLEARAAAAACSVVQHVYTSMRLLGAVRCALPCAAAPRLQFCEPSGRRAGPPGAPQARTATTAPRCAPRCTTPANARPSTCQTLRCAGGGAGQPAAAAAAAAAGMQNAVLLLVTCAPLAWLVQLQRCNLTCRSLVTATSCSGPRKTIFHNPKDVVAAIVTCEQGPSAVALACCPPSRRSVAEAVLQGARRQRMASPAASVPALCRRRPVPRPQRCGSEHRVHPGARGHWAWQALGPLACCCPSRDQHSLAGCLTELLPSSLPRPPAPLPRTTTACRTTRSLASATACAASWTATPSRCS